PSRQSPKKNRTKRMSSLRYLGQAVEDLPGDIHIKKHEWAYLRTQLRDEPEGTEDASSRRRDGSSVNSAQSEPSRLSVSAAPDGVSEISRAWHRQAARINAVKRLLPNHRQTRWYKPLGKSDVSKYANDYVLSFGCGPFDKHQLLSNS
ncbi:hypothetical protein FOZ62_020651, partial [Perkinsus olseni]